MCLIVHVRQCVTIIFLDTFIDGWSKHSQHDEIVEEEEYNILREATDYYNNDWATSTDFDSENNLEYYSELDYDSEYPHDADSTKNLLRDDTDYSDNDWASSSDYAPEDDFEYYSDEHDDKDDMGSGENPGMSSFKSPLYYNFI